MNPLSHGSRQSAVGAGCHRATGSAVATLTGFACILLLMTACRSKNETFRDNNIAGGELRSPFQSIFAHLSEEHYLTIHGSTYRGVRGGPPYYLSVPALNSILFVNGDESDNNVRFHIVNLATGHDIVINGGQSHFGAHIGMPVNDSYPDCVLTSDSKKITLASTGRKATVIIVLNLSTKKVESSSWK